MTLSFSSPSPSPSPSPTYSSQSHSYSYGPKGKLPGPLFFFSPTKPRPRWPRMVYAPTAATLHRHHHRKKEKIVVIMGATGCGKSKLSIDLANRFHGEIINSDKMQVYSGLDITTNKIPLHERLGVPHHLLGEVDPEDGELTPSDFRQRAGSVISDITSRNKLPLLVGGSNSFIHALLVDRFDPESNVFHPSHPLSISSELRYNCCFLWVDVSFMVLTEYLLKRVDDMFDSGMFGELEEFYDSVSGTALRKAIGISEFDRYFKKYPPGGDTDNEIRRLRDSDSDTDDPLRRGLYDEAVREIKDNTCQLAERQIWKIKRLREAGWDLRKLDATEAFRAVMMTSSDPVTVKKRWSEIWERQVLEPSVKIVKRFLEE